MIQAAFTCILLTSWTCKKSRQKFLLGVPTKAVLTSMSGRKLQGRKKGIPFYTFRINKHFSVKYDQVSGTDVIFLRQGIQLIPVKRVYPPQSWRDILTNLFSWMTYERRDQSCMSCKQQKADYVNVSVCFSAICKCYQQVFSLSSICYTALSFVDTFWRDCQKMSETKEEHKKSSNSIVELEF